MNILLFCFKSDVLDIFRKWGSVFVDLDDSRCSETVKVGPFCD